MQSLSLLDILRHTPWWAYAIFAGLLALGVQQSRSRTVGVARLLVLPLCMAALSLVGVVSAFGSGPAALACWALGLGMAGFAVFAVFGKARPQPQYTPAAAHAATAGLFVVPGSWWPLVCMMGIFAIQYAARVAQARQLAVLAQPWVSSLGGWLLGVLSGIFLARALAIYRQQRR